MTEITPLYDVPDARPQMPLLCSACECKRQHVYTASAYVDDPMIERAESWECMACGEPRTLYVLSDTYATAARQLVPMKVTL